VPRTVHTLRSLAWLLRYPDDTLRAQLGALRDALHHERALTFGRLVEIDALIDQLQTLPPLRAEADYVELFDRGRRTSLHLFEHVHGDSRDRGPAMVDLVRTYEAAGLMLGPGELPDFLPVLLEYASTQPAEGAREFLREFAHIVRVIFSALVERRSAYAALPAALLDLAGERAERVVLAEEPALDESWAEPQAFDGCASRGQQAPQASISPIRIHRPARAAGGKRAAA
jgi:nitrate reductase delta subunit